jgi:signal transduction histidine kinase/CheY-like chemotaxis protein
MLPSRRNTLQLQLGVAAALLSVCVVLLFTSLLSAASSARSADKQATASRALVTVMFTARGRVLAADPADPTAVRQAGHAASQAATAADGAEALGPAVGNSIRTAATAYGAAPATGRGPLAETLGIAASSENSAATGRSGDMTSSVKRAVILGVAGLIGVILTMLFFGRRMRQSVIKPIRRLAANARRLGSGDLTTRLPEDGVADLKDLSRSLNSMSVSLEATRKTLDVQHAQVASSRAETNRANTAKNEFLSRMSHELRTPLNAILGFAQLLELDELDARQRDNVAHIVSGGRHLLDLINEVLEITRIEAGSMTPVIEPVHAGNMVREAIELVGPLAAQREIELTQLFDTEDDVWIAADPQRLKQILLNLLANAVKYNRDAGSVIVRLKRLGDRARIEVTDTGQGIPQDQLPRLFIPFERLGAESTGVEGTGLGLVLALRLAEAMNGTLGAESQPWIGSTFHIELPLAEAPDQRVAAPLPSRLTVAGPAAESNGETRRVLYIEDDVANTHLMSRLFAEEPRLELMTTMYGKLGIELARQHVPDLILLDAHLPDLGGDEVIKRLRGDSVTRAIPVIAVSADATGESRARLTALGAEQYLTKPLTLNVVLTAVWDVLDKPVVPA